MKTDTIFRESQFFRQKWLLGLMFSLCLLFIVGIISQIFMGVPFGDNPAPDWLLILLTLAMFGMTTLFYYASLKTAINTEGVHVYFTPFKTKPRTIRWEEIESWQLRESVPLQEFGGWGYRLGPGGTVAYTTQGRNVLELNLTNGKKVVIGTQDVEAIAQTMQKIEQEFTLELLDLKKQKEQVKNKKTS